MAAAAIGHTQYFNPAPEDVLEGPLRRIYPQLLQRVGAQSFSYKARNSMGIFFAAFVAAVRPSSVSPLAVNQVVLPSCVSNRICIVLMFSTSFMMRR
jgi:hypothetical protein